MSNNAQLSRKTITVNQAATRHFAKVNKMAGYKALVALSANLPAPPISYDPSKYYRVQLTQAVRFGGHWLRPADDVVVRGDFAQAHHQYISGARAI